jgi:hypothetical protein
MLRNKRFFLVLVFILVTGLACNLGSAAAPKPAASGQGDAASSTAPAQNNQGSAKNDSIPSSPIGLRQGLASLNSYRMTIRMVNNGPTALDKSDSTFFIESGSDGKSTHIKNTSTSSSEKEPEVSTSESDDYVIGNHRCNVPKDSEVDKSDMDPMVREVADAWYGLLDLTPSVNEPVFIGAEDLNGVKTNHFKFKVGGLGVDSGAEVVTSNGEYWLAQDGQYIVKYIVTIETRSGPAGDANTKTVHSEFSIEVQDINQNIVIEMPPACQ